MSQNNRRGATRRVASPAASKSRPQTTKKAGQKTTVVTPSASASFEGLWASHKSVARESLSRLFAQFWSSMMTWAVIGIALSLPLALNLIVDNVAQASKGWDGAPQLSLYLQPTTTESQAQKLALEVGKRPGIIEANYVSPDQALKEFQSASGFGAVIEGLDENPLPGVIVVKPVAETIDVVETLQQELANYPAVALAQLDIEWVQRLYSMMSLLERLVLALSLLLALAVMLVVGNTIRLAIESRRDEILVVKLVGGSDSFVRRPFLYTGIWYGLGGALFAWLVIQVSLLWLGGAVERLASLYHEQFQLQGMGLSLSLSLFLTASFLGWFGARLSLGRHLRAIEP